jgi:HlyD family secretion protein
MIKNWHRGVALVGVLLGCQESRDVPAGYQGVVEFEERLLSFEVGGRVASVAVAEGDRVELGDVVAALDDELAATERAARAAEQKAAEADVGLVRAGARVEQVAALAARLRAARASERLLERQHERDQRLLANGVTTAAALDEVATQLATARANRQALEQELAALRHPRRQEVEGAEARAMALANTVALGDARLERHLLSAPLSATVLDVHAREGEVVAPGTPVLTLGDTQEPYVDVFVPVGEIGTLTVGAPAQVRVDASDRSFAAHVAWIARTTEFTPRFLFSERERPNLVVRVRLVIDEPGDALHAGVPAFATLGAPPSS